MSGRGGWTRIERSRRFGGRFSVKFRSDRPGRGGASESPADASADVVCMIYVGKWHCYIHRPHLGTLYMYKLGEACVKQ
jgi:hypothetical protein